MRIVCPSCQAAYEVPDKLLSGPARRVRCAKCGEHWVPGAVPAQGPAAPPDVKAAPPRVAPALPPPAAEEAPRAPEPAPPPRLALVAAAAMPRAEEKLVPEVGPEPGRSLVLAAVLAWVASVAALVALGWAMVAFRAEVMAAWEPSRRLYALLGLG